MPSKSKAQQRFFGMVDAYKKGEMKNPSSKIKKAANGMSMSDVKDFAETKHKGLPEKVEEQTIIRLTESDLHKIVKESVKRILKESYSDIYGNGVDYVQTMIDNAYSLSKTPEEFDERMRKIKKYLDNKKELALNNHPQAAPFNKVWKNNKLLGGKSMDASLYA